MLTIVILTSMFRTNQLISFDLTSKYVGKYSYREPGRHNNVTRKILAHAAY